MNKHFIIASKVCTNCKKDKSVKFFRKRLDKRRNYEYYNNTCRKCDAELSWIYRQGVKNTPEYKKKNLEASKKYRIDNLELCLYKQKIYREKTESRLRRNKYNKKNRKRIKELHKIPSKKFAKKEREKLSVNYVKTVMKLSALERKKIPEEIIEAKKLHILLVRKIKERDKKSI